MQLHVASTTDRGAAWARPYRQRRRRFPRLGLTTRQAMAAALLAILLAGLTGCGLEAPETPHFETTINVPAADESYDTAQLIESSEYLDGGAGNGAADVVIDGTFGPTTVGAALDVTLDADAWSARLNTISVPQPPDLNARFGLQQMLGIAVADSGDSVVVPEVLIPPTRNTLPVFDQFEAARLSGGTLSITLHNRLPVPLGSTDGTTSGLVLRLRDALTGDVVFTCPTHARIESGERVVFVSDLTGIVFPNRLEAEVEGMSPGSDAKPVLAMAADALDLKFALTGLAYDWVRLEPPAQSVTVAEETILDESVRLDAAELRAGVLTGVLRNTLPLPVAVRLTSPDLSRGGAFEENWIVPAGNLVTPGTLPVSIDMSGVSYRSTIAGGSPALHLELTGSTAADALPVTLDSRMGLEFTLDAATLELDQVTATFDARPVTLTPSVSQPDLPEEIDPVRFDRATLTIDVENGAGVSAVTDLVVRGVRNGRPDVLLPLAGHAIAPATALGPTTTRITLTESNSTLLDLLHHYPDEIRLEGQVTLGDGATPGIVRRSDAVTGRYHLSAPLRVRFSTVERVAESFSFDIDADAQTQIREHVTAADVKVRVTNHFPIGVTLLLGFGADSLGAADSADVSLVPVTIEAAPVGPDGRTTGPRVQDVVLTIPSERIGFFARDVVWGSAHLTLHGAGPDQTIEIQSTDYVNLKALARFRYEVK